MLVPPGREQLRVLHEHYLNAEPDVRALLLNTFSKLSHAYGEVAAQVGDVLRAASTAMDQEVQQRSAAKQQRIEQRKQIKSGLVSRDGESSEGSSRGSGTAAAGAASVAATPAPAHVEVVSQPPAAAAARSLEGHVPSTRAKNSFLIGKISS